MLDEVAAAPPTAELRPIERVRVGAGRWKLRFSRPSLTLCVPIHILQKRKQKNGGGEEGAGGEEEEGEHSQIDEEDMGISYQELGIYGRLRKIERCVRSVSLVFVRC